MNGATKTMLPAGMEAKASKSRTGQLPALGIRMPTATAMDNPHWDRECRYAAPSIAEA